MSIKEKYLKQLNMQYLEGEGGYYIETHRAKDQRLEIRDEDAMVLQHAVSDDSRKDLQATRRDLYTTIYYLMERCTPPVLNKSDHVHFYHDGSPIKYYWLDMKNKKLEHAVLGPNIADGQHFHVMVPGGVLKWAEVLDDGINDRCSLVSECVMPGFEFEDMTVYSKERLQSMFPEFWEDIQKGYP